MTKARQLELWNAAEARDPAGVAAALARGADPDQPLTAREYLDWAAGLKRGEGRPEYVVDGSGLSEPKFYVLFEALPHRATLEALLAARPRLDVVNDNYFEGRPTAVHQLVHPEYECEEEGDDDEVPARLELLLAAGAPLEQLYEGHTPLQLLCRGKGRLDLLEILLAHGASVQAVDQGGYSILHLATGIWKYRQLWLRESLAGTIFYNADGEPVGLERGGWMRLDRASHYKPAGPYLPTPEDDLPDPSYLWGVREAVRALVDAGADPNAINPNTGNTSLHDANEEGHIYLEAMEALLEFGARADIRNHEGRLAGDFYFREDDQEAAALHKRMAALSSDSTR